MKILHNKQILQFLKKFNYLNLKEMKKNKIRKNPF